jgi:hypothetical protein
MSLGPASAPIHTHRAAKSTAPWWKAAGHCAGIGIGRGMSAKVDLLLRDN